jgi:uncharacterized membrane protein
MIFPANFVAGALIGAVSTYVLKDESARTWIKDTGDKIKERGSSFITSFKKKPEESTEASTEKENVIENTVEKSVEQQAEQTIAAAKDEKVEK